MPLRGPTGIRTLISALQGRCLAIATMGPDGEPDHDGAAVNLLYGRVHHKGNDCVYRTYSSGVLREGFPPYLYVGERAVKVTKLYLLDVERDPPSV